MIPLKDAAAVNSTRFAVVKAAKKHSPNVWCWTGGRTKFNRFSQNLIKTHSIDAACVGDSGAFVVFRTHQTLLVDCNGHGSRQSRRNNAFGFPVITVKVDKATRKKVVKTIEPKQNYTHAKSGDVVKINLEKSRKHLSQGIYAGRVKTPTPKGVETVIQGHRISVDIKHVQFIHHSDGYAYQFAPVLSNLFQEFVTS